MHVGLATIDLSGSRSVTNVNLSKRPGSLDFDAPASAIGLQVPVTLHLRGTALRDGWIHYTIAESYSPPVNIGAGHSISSIAASFDAQAMPLPATTRQTHGNVVLSAFGRNTVTARLEFGTLSVPLTRLAIVGGIVQPALYSFVDPSRTTICSSRISTTHAFSINLADLARGNGATVALTAPSTGGVHVPAGITVGAGQRSVTLNARIDANFVGTVRLTATAGGIARSLGVVVHPSIDCLR